VGVETPLVRVAGVLLYEGERVLLQHRDDNPDIAFPGAWAFFGGHGEPGETPDETARRELQEELGLTLDGPLEPFYHNVEDGRERTIFKAPLTVPLESLRQTEGQGMALLTEAELDDLPVVPRHREILRRFFTSR
jgi:8-oxo-dGTP diphosphatase